MSPWYATNARMLLDSRQQGLRPTGPVVVSLVGGDFSDCADVALYVRPEMPVAHMDWRMLVNLDVWVWADARASLDWLIAVTWSLAKAKPAELLLRFAHAGAIHDVDVGSGYHIPAMLDTPAINDFFWLPVNASGTDLGRRLTRALAAKHTNASIQ